VDTEVSRILSVASQWELEALASMGMTFPREVQARLDLWAEYERALDREAVVNEVQNLARPLKPSWRKATAQAVNAVTVAKKRKQKIRERLRRRRIAA
jgi:hypothetical protein